MGFFIIGINHKDCPVEIREKLYFSSRKLEAGLDFVKRIPELAELVILSTCNRVEFYGYTESSKIPEDKIFDLIREIQGIDRKEYLHYLYRYQDGDAIRHLFRVTAGLDSLVVGENEILGQIREAFRNADVAQTVHFFLFRLMEKALKLGKDARTQTKINEGAVSIPSAAVELAEKIFGRLKHQKVMVLGTGEMSTLSVKNLKNAGAQVLYVVSHHQERGEKLAAECHAEWVPFENMEEKFQDVDIFIAATTCPHPIVRADPIRRLMETRKGRPFFVIDIAVPRNVESHVSSIQDVFLYNVDDLRGVAASNLSQRTREIQAVEVLIEKASVDFRGWLEQLKARPTIERFESFLNDILDSELARAGKALPMEAEEKTRLRDRIRGKLLHPPLEKIKEAAKAGNTTKYLDALHALFDLDKRA